jgi:putative spermidine/putrescine transport system ATP-binding protein/spermidine/putrescine transport system ATP-binding protein
MRKPAPSSPVASCLLGLPEDLSDLVDLGEQLVGPNVGFPLRMRKVARAEAGRRVRQALEIVRLTGFEDRYPRQLSGGQQQRAALARALVIDPKILLLDEPLSALDKHLRASMQVELRELQRRLGVTAIFVTHDQGEALSLSDRVVVMADGVIRQIGTPRDIYNQPADRFVASFVGDVSVFRGSVAAVDGERLDVRLGQTRVTGAATSYSDARPGDAADIFIRPEALQIAPSGEAAIASGTIGAVVFQGGHADIWINTQHAPSGRVLTRVPASDSMVRLPLGKPVHLAIAPEREVSIFPPEPR